MHIIYHKSIFYRTYEILLLLATEQCAYNKMLSCRSNEHLQKQKSDSSLISKIEENPFSFPSPVVGISPPLRKVILPREEHKHMATNPHPRQIFLYLQPNEFESKPIILHI